MHRFRLILLLLIISTSLIAEIIPCSQSQQALFYIPDQKLEKIFNPSFEIVLFDQLSGQLQKIGYCLVRSDSLESLRDSSQFENNLIMYVSVKTEADSNVSEAEIIVSLIKIKDFNTQNLYRSLDHPLATLSLQPADWENRLLVLTKKIIENLRMQYICYLSISSEPEGVTIITESGLEDKTPFKWVLPVATMKIKGTAPGYVSLKKEITLEHPGEYSYFLQLKERQFYHSKFIYPAAVCGLAVIGCYIADKYYFDTYTSLGETDYYNNPGKFESTFNTAKMFERLTVASFGLSALFLAISFRY